MTKKVMIVLCGVIIMIASSSIGTFLGMLGYDRFRISHISETPFMEENTESVPDTELDAAEPVVHPPVSMNYYSTASKSLWSWETPTSADFIDPQIERIGNCTRVYQYISSASITNANYLETVRFFVTHMNDIGIEVYATNGDPQWSIDRRDALTYIDAIGTLKESGLNFAGIVFDNEVYLLDDYKERSAEYNEAFIENSYKYYLRAKEYGLKYVPTLASYQLDKYPEFASIYENSDMVSIMNYVTDKDLYLDMMEAEVELSQQLGKPIECIFHIGSSDHFEPESDFQSIDDVFNAFSVVADYFQSEWLTFSMHHAGAF